MEFSQHHMEAFFTFNPTSYITKLCPALNHTQAPNVGTAAFASVWELTLLLLLSEVSKTISSPASYVQYIHEPRQKFLLPRTDPTSPSLVSLFPFQKLPEVCFLW